MFNVNVDAKSEDLFLAYQSTKRHLMQVAPVSVDRNAIAALLLVAAARDNGGKDASLQGEFTISGLLPNHNITVAVSTKAITTARKTPKKRQPKTSIPTKKVPILKNQEDNKKKRTKVGDDLYRDGNGYYFNGKGQAVGANGKPTTDPYNIRIDPNLNPSPTLVVPQGSAGLHGAHGGDDF